jgi:hypothetical protein
MSINPKLEFYRFELNHKNQDTKSFKDFIIEELKAKNTIADSKVTELFFKHFLNSLKGKHAKNDRLQKKICIEKSSSINKYYSKKPTFDSSNFTISGVINGGPYGRDRIISNNDDDDDSTSLGRNKAILLYFYFFIYLPVDHNEGFFMIHSNSIEESITNVFRNYVLSLFKGKNYNKPVAVEYCPKSFQDEFLKGAILKTITFKTSFIDDIPNAVGISNILDNYDLKIEATPKNKNILGSNAEGILQQFYKKIFGSKEKTKSLENFDETKIVLESDIANTTKTFEWNTKDNDFVPVVYLKNRIAKLNDDGTPDFDELKTFCSNIFKDEILPEIRPDLYVTKA